jgi:rare lipoprotein A
MRRFALLLLPLLMACATTERHPADSASRLTSDVSQVFTEEGLASWYGKEYHGQPTSSGETFNMNDLTAAHRTLPFGTRVEVNCANTDRTVDVRINDRGPFIPGRIIDLSYKAAVDLGIVGKGLEKVRIRAKGLAYAPQPSREAEQAPKPLVVQVGAFKNAANAARLRERLLDEFRVVTLQTFGKFTRVLIGPLEDEEEAARAVEQAQAMDLSTIVRPVGGTPAP